MLPQGYGLLPRNGGDTMSRFEQAISKNKVSSNVISLPCEVKAQTVAVRAKDICVTVFMRDFPISLFVFGMGFFVAGKS
jgi:hypothetical protein